MCRPSCCKPSREGTGIAAVAVVAAAVAAVKIGPVLARIWHIAIEALTIFTLTCAAAAACILVTWAVARIIRARRTPPPGVYRLSQPGTDVERITQLRQQLAAEQARARQAEILIGSLLTGPYVPEPLHREPPELSSPRSTQGGHDGRP